MSLSGWRAAYEPRMLVTSPSVWRSRTGASASVRKIVGRRRRAIRRCRLTLPGSTSGSADAAPAVHEEAVEGLRQRLHAVVVGDQGERRLRLAGGDAPVGLEAAASPSPPRSARRDLGVDVVGEAVAGVVERAVAGRVDRLEALARGAPSQETSTRTSDRTALDADALRRHADPDVARRA